jgi:V/A-type H+-transporting ATPase subunit I
MACLSRTGAVELEGHGEAVAGLPLPELRRRLDGFGELARRYRAYWPTVVPRGPMRPESPIVTTDRTLARVRDWAAKADGVIVRLQSLAKERADLGLLYLLPGSVWPERLPMSVLHQRLQAAEQVYLLAVGPRDPVAALEEQLKALKARAIDLPDWLPADARQAADAVAERLDEIERLSLSRQADLERLADACDLTAALADLAVVQWFATHARDLPATAHFAWITGWTSDRDGRRLHGCLRAADVRHLLHFPGTPGGAEAPMIFRNPAWARPFEIFARLLGTPAANEADPSRIVAVIGPILFGYMFGDVGQGLVLVLAGIALRRRLPPLQMLIPGGIMAIAFGFLFGSVFSREDVIPALWLHPLEQPVTVLLVTLVGGAVILTLGLALDGIQAHWRGEGRLWWSGTAGLVAGYLGLLFAFVQPRALSVAAVGALWYVAGTTWQASDRRPAAAGKALARLIEGLAQLVVNTVSFARVGAFALAHAGLSAAITGVAETTRITVVLWIVMLVGNLLVIVLEGLVVGIQTTRLVLFEFFVRFLRAGGRAFRPLPPPTWPTSKAEGGSS